MYHTNVKLNNIYIELNQYYFDFDFGITLFIFPVIHCYSSYIKL